jgi:hypothetical protein
MYYELNPNHQKPFKKTKVSSVDNDTMILIEYKDRGWCNSGVKHCECPSEYKDTIDNSLYKMRGTDVVTICDRCNSFVHTDMSD